MIHPARKTQLLSIPFLLGALGAALPAQSPTYVRDEFFANREGNATFTYPFGRQSAGMQTILANSFVSTGFGAISAIHFRPNGNSYDNTYSGYTKAYDVQMAVVPTTPTMMTTDPVANYGGVTPVMVFSGPINIATTNPQLVAPRPWTIMIPLTSIFTYDGTQGGNLLIDIRTDPNDTTSPPSSYPIDAMLYRNAFTEGAAEDYVSGCETPSAHNLRLVPSRSNLLVGGSVDATLTARTGTTQTDGLFPVALMALGLDRTEIDLGVLGMPNCIFSPNLDAISFLSDSGTGFPAYTVPIPNNMAVLGAVVYTQALGWAQPGVTFNGSVTSDAFWLEVRSNSNPPEPFQSAFDTNPADATWAKSNAGPYGPVFGFDGVLP